MDSTGITPVMPVGGMDGAFGGGNAFIWIFGLLILLGLFNGGFGGFGNNAQFADVATKDYVSGVISNQSTQSGLQDILLSSANNNYETAQLISAQTNSLMQQNYANQINVIQGFNALQQQISNLSYHMDECCCQIKTQMLESRLSDAQTALNAANNNISNANQSQYILSQLGRFVAWTPSGTQTVSAGT